MLNRDVLKESRQIYGTFIKNVIKKNQLSIERISKELNIGKPVIYNILNGKGYSIDSFLALTNYLKISVHLIFI